MDESLTLGERFVVDLVVAIVSAAFFTVGIWAVFSILGEPEWTDGHLTSFYLWTGWIYALGRFTWPNDRRKP